MTTAQIETLFFEVIQEKAIYNKTDSFTENQIYNWRKKRTQPSIGDMLGLLYKLNKIEVKLPFSDVFDAAAKKHKFTDQRVFKRNEYGEMVEITPNKKKEVIVETTSFGIDKDGNLTHTVVLQGEPKTEVFLDKNGNKIPLEPVTRPNPNEPNPK